MCVASTGTETDLTSDTPYYNRCRSDLIPSPLSGVPRVCRYWRMKRLFSILAHPRRDHRRADQHHRARSRAPQSNTRASQKEKHHQQNQGRERQQQQGRRQQTRRQTRSGARFGSCSGGCSGILGNCHAEYRNWDFRPAAAHSALRDCCQEMALLDLILQLFS